MRNLFIIGIAISIAQQCVAPPVTKNKSTTEEENKVDPKDYAKQVGVEYHRYLGEVFEVLEGDEEFQAKLKNASKEDIMSGHIAEELNFVKLGLRDQLDVIKGKEIRRLRRAATDQFEMEKGLKMDRMKIHEHIDHENPNTFEVEDLKKLILKTTADLSEIDQRRREEFQQYEMKKKYETEEKRKKMNEEEKKKYDEEMKQLEEKHKKHKPLHHPGSKQQYEEVWEKQDQMEDMKFDARTFFNLHDLDGNGYWDPVEVNALFLKELDKIYQEGGPENEKRERIEEMERMREHVFSEADYNKDSLISYAEFVQQSKTAEFEKDEGWKTLDEQQLYTDEEYERFVKHQQEMLRGKIHNGIPVPEYPSHDAGYQQQFAPQYAVPNPGYAPPMGDPSHHQQPYQGQMHQQQFQGHFPQQEYQQGQQQVPGYQQQVPQYPQVPQYQQASQYHPQGQVLPQQYQGQMIQQQANIQQQGHVPQQGQAPQQIHVQPQAQVQMPHQQQQQAPIQGQISQQAPIQGQISQKAPIQGQVQQPTKDNGASESSEAPRQTGNGAPPVSQGGQIV